MAGQHSAGILLFRRRGDLEVLLGHLGGPFWARRDAGAWSIPKGEPDAAEAPEAAARREFAEELGLPVPPVDLVALGSARQAGGKVVTVWAGESDLDVAAVRLGTFSLEWPPRSGRVQEFPELDRVEWCGLGVARDRVVAAQRVFLDRLADLLEHGGRPADAP